MRRQWLVVALVCWGMAGLLTALGCSSLGEPKIPMGKYDTVIQFVVTDSIPGGNVAWSEWRCFPGPPTWCQGTIYLDPLLTGVDHELRHIMLNSTMGE